MFDVKVKIGDKERINKFGYLPDDFNRPPWLLPNGVKSDEVPLYEDDDIKAGCYDMLLDERDDMPLDDMLLDEEDYNEEDRKSYILNVQAKLRKTYVLKQSFKTVEPDQMFTDKNYNSNPPGVYLPPI
ncbi:unnamed protein product [Rhizophagus irregularis]|nr:unnamed protein product [Rhizophagus irregularis]